MQSLFDFLRRYRREDGSELCEPFIRAPKRRTDPQYYEVVTDPLDLLRIHQKLKTEEYGEVDEVRADFQKVIDNALKYYKDDTDEHEAAREMQNQLNKAMEKVRAGEDPVATLSNREESEEGELTEMLEELFAAVIEGKDSSEGRLLHTQFRFLPSQKVVKSVFFRFLRFSRHLKYFFGRDTRHTTSSSRPPWT